MKVTVQLPEGHTAAPGPVAYTEQDARDFAMIWLADGFTAAQMREVADDPEHHRRVRARLAACGITGMDTEGQSAMRAAAAAELEAEGFDAAAFAREPGICDGAR